MSPQLIVKGTVSICWVERDGEGWGLENSMYLDGSLEVALEYGEEVMQMLCSKGGSFSYRETHVKTHVKTCVKTCVKTHVKTCVKTQDMCTKWSMCRLQ